MSQWDGQLDLTALDDEDLVRRAQESPGSPASNRAAAELLTRYRDKVYAWCRRYVRDHERALDLAQDVLVKAYRSLDGFEGRARFSSWLFAIARNRCLNEAARPRLFEESGLDLDLLPANMELPGAVLEDQEEEEELLRLVCDVLEPDERLAVWLRCCERLPVDEVTGILGLTSASGARGLLQAARRKLRVALERRWVRERERQ